SHGVRQPATKSPSLISQAASTAEKPQIDNTVRTTSGILGSEWYQYTSTSDAREVLRGGAPGGSEMACEGHQCTRRAIHILRVTPLSSMNTTSQLVANALPAAHRRRASIRRRF
ncbi:hypothetical protein DERF_010974, partial [Dermatophagoides farinae]